jgi:indolepyruvate ferredoxin oxidoreductase alpha subunit
MAYKAFEISEQFKLPVLIRITTRLSHSRSGVIRKELKPENSLTYPDDPIQFVLLTSNARKRYKGLLSIQAAIEEAAEKSEFNHYYQGKDKSLGIIACGIAYNYLMENYPDNNCQYPVLKIGQYPMPYNLLDKIVNECSKILVLEDGYPFVEEQIKGYFDKSGKITG